MPPNMADNDLAAELGLASGRPVVFQSEGADGTPAAFTDGSIPSCTYSGADIRMVAHLPSEEGSAAVHEIETLRNENQEFAEEQERFSTPAARRNQLQLAINFNLQRINRLMEEVNNAAARTITIAELSTLSVSIHREKFPVRPLGSVYARSYTRGGRTISGSMVYAVFHRHLFQELIEASSYRSTGVGDWDRFRYTTEITDQLPPLDFSIRFANEYGNVSWMGLFGLEFINEGMVMSSEDLVIEGTNTYVARDLDLIRNVANRPLRRNRGVGQQLNGTRLLQENIDLRLRGRRYPFL